MTVRALLALPLLLVALPADASKVYRWTDAEGRVHYGDNAPPGVEATRRHDLPSNDPERFAELEVQRDGGIARVLVRNRTPGPVQVELSLSDRDNVIADPELPLTRLLQPRQSIEIARIGSASPAQNSSFELKMQALPGDPQALPRDVVYSLPIDERHWQLGQGFNGSYSHNDDQNRYAIDLVVDEGTPVLAARDGVVIQVESGFSGGGKNHQRYVDRANLIRVLHDDGSMAVYAHLREDGVLVRHGQSVSVGQHIGYSGNTGYSSGPHLHFVVQANTGMRLVSLPFRMIGPQGFLPLH